MTYPRRLYILCWSELSRRKLSPTLATPTTLVLITLVAQCELSRRKIGLLLEVVGRKFSHRRGNPATVGVVRWPAAGDTAGSSLRRLSSLQHRIYNLLGRTGHADEDEQLIVGGPELWTRPTGDSQTVARPSPDTVPTGHVGVRCGHQHAVARVYAARARGYLPTDTAHTTSGHSNGSERQHRRPTQYWWLAAFVASTKLTHVGPG